MFKFPIIDLLDKQECYNFLLNVLHPDGLKCPHGHLLPSLQSPHTRRSIPKYKCRTCGSVFNLFTGSVWSGTHYDCATIIMVMRGFVQGTSTKHLAEELELDYSSLLERRHRIQGLALENRIKEALTDPQTEADEMYQNAGEKGTIHNDPDDPPRVRANKRRGLGTMDNDRPPVLGVVGRTTGQIRLKVCDNTQQATIQPQVENDTLDDTNLCTDESSAYNHIGQTGRKHATVCHSAHEWARDDDGDGIREVHSNTMEGIWTGLRNFLRPFRGIHKNHLKLYVVMFEWAHNFKQITDGILRAMMTPHFTYLPT